MKGDENQRGNVRLKGWLSCMQVCESSRDRVIAFPSSATLFLSFFFFFHLPPSQSLRVFCVFSSPCSRHHTCSLARSLTRRFPFSNSMFLFFSSLTFPLYTPLAHCHVSLMLFLTRPSSPSLFSSKRFLGARFAFRRGAPPVT